jgi:signal transduction histidine kinase
VTDRGPSEPSGTTRWIRHVAVGVPLGLAWTITLGTALALGVVAFPLGVVVAGLALLLAELGAEIERDRAARALADRPARGEPSGRERALHRRVIAAARSRATWREVAYLLTFGPLIVVMAAVAATIVFAALAAATSGWWLADEPGEILGVELARPLLVVLLGATGLAVLLAIPTIARSFGWLYRSHLGLLGPAADALRRRADDAERRRRLLEQAAAAERARIERDLHDGLQPLLVSSAVTISSARRLLANDPARAAERLTEVQDQLRQAMDDVRALVQGLAPRSLQEVGLDEALGELVASVPVPCRLTVAIATEPPTETAGVAYFVASEAITNAVRHSDTDRIDVAVRSRGDALSVSVQDRGTGGAVARPGGGLAGLTARVEAAGGRLELASAPGRGTAVTAHLPLDPDPTSTRPAVNTAP